MVIDARIAALMKAREHAPCISMVLPTARTIPDKVRNKTTFKKLIDSVKQELQQQPASMRAQLDKRLDQLFDTYDAVHTVADGYAFFMNQVEVITVPLYGQCTERAHVGVYFDLTDLIFHLQIPELVWVLMLGGDRAQLFKSSYGQLSEVVTPLVDDKGNAVQGFPLTALPPADKVIRSVAVMDKGDRYYTDEVKRFFRLVDQELFKKITQESLPVVLCATPEHVTLYHEVAQHKLITEELAEECSKWPHERLAAEVRKALEKQDAAVEMKLLHEFQEALGYNRQASGIMYTWEAIQAGRVHTLFVESSNEERGRVVPGNPAHIYRLGESREYPSDCLTDIFIAETLRHRGTVRVVSPGKLQAPDGIGAILRF